MSNLLKDKISEVATLLRDAETEEAEGVRLTAKIAELTKQSADCNESARQKRAFGEAQQMALKALGVAPDAIAPKKGRLAAVASPVTQEEVTKAARKAAKKAAKTGKAAKVTVEPPTPIETSKKAKKVKAAKAVKATAAKSTEQRVAGDDKMPPLHERLKIVIGKEDVTIPQAIDLLRARNADWVPDSSDLKAYISLALSTHVKDLFDRVSRGVYRVKVGPGSAVKKDVTVPVKKAHAQKVNGTNGTSNGTIQDLGENVMDSPFSGAAA